MDARIFVSMLSLAGALGAAGVAHAQHEGHQPGAAAAPSAALAQCRQAQPVVTGLLSASLKRLEDARLTNSAVAMRDAAEDVQVALVDVRTQLAPCGEMAATSPAVPGAQVAPTSQQAAAPAAPEQHAGHTAAPPAATSPQAPAPGAKSPAGRLPSPSHAHADHAAPPAASPPAAPPRPAAARNPTAPVPPTTIADLKCSQAVDRKTAPRMLYQGRMYYFCTDASRAEFAKDPTKFETAPPQTAPGHAH